MNKNESDGILMKILGISKNVFNKHNNMSKKLCGCFSQFPSNEIEQLYLRQEIPTDKD